VSTGATDDYSAQRIESAMAKIVAGTRAPFEIEVLLRSKI
jgi:hypothetical protein